jgi:alpha-N-arabinofuranosidase
LPDLGALKFGQSRSTGGKTKMPMNRREFLAASMAGAAVMQQGMKAFGDPATDIRIAIDATTIGEPINPLIFGGYMEPATTRAWAEVLSDRKFLRPITDAAPPPPANGFMRRFMGQPWRPVGPPGTVEMDTVQPWVGEQSPRIKLDATEPHGISQSGLRLGGKSYVGRIYLAGDPGTKVDVRLVWGAGAADSQTISISSLAREYKKFLLKFNSPVDTQDARLEIIGTGSGAFQIGAVSLMPSDNVQGFHAGIIKYLKDTGFLMAKWPGGNFVSGYDWRDGLGDPDKRPPKPETMWGNAIESNDIGIHEFIAFCRLLGAEPDVAVNTGFGEARVAADEVEYCNGSTETRMGKLRAENGHAEPFNVRLWTIGNEMYGPWQFGYMSLNQYWVKHNDFVREMKKVDPKILVAAATATICESSWCAAEQKQFENSIWRPAINESLPFKFGGINDWDGWMLKNSADYIDNLSEHTYCYPDMAFDAEKQAFVDVEDPLPLRTRRMANRIGAAFAAWDKFVETMPELKQKDIKFIFDEWGARYRVPQGGSARPQGMVTPLSYANFLHEMFRHSGMIRASCPTGSFGTVLTDGTGDGVGLAADALVIKLLRAHFAGALPVAVSGNSPQQPMRGTPFVDMGPEPTGSPTYPLDVAAAFSADRKTFILSVINPSEEAQHFAAHISGITLRDTGKLWQLAAPSVNAANEPGKEPVIKINETEQGSLPETVPVPPISVNVYEYEIA